MRMTQQQEQPQQRQFQFDQIYVAKSSSSYSATANNAFNFSISSSVIPAVLIYERKYVFAGAHANWKLNLKDLLSVRVETTTTSPPSIGGGRHPPFMNTDQRFSHHHRHNRFAHSHGGTGLRGGMNNNKNSSEILTLTLVGPKISMKCIARMYPYSRGGRDNDRQRQLEEFIHGLKSLHGKMTSKQMKHGEDYDNYNYDDEKKSIRGETRWDAGSFRQQHHHQQQMQARKRIQVVTPAQPTNHKSATSLFLQSPAREKKKHPTSGVFQSPARTNTSPSSSSMRQADHRSNVGGSMRRNSGEGHAHHDPAADEGEETELSPDSSVVITGNVVPSPSAVRKLDLPSRSPRNASPVKLRKTMSRLPSRRVDINAGRQLQGISGGDIRLRERNGMMMTTTEVPNSRASEFEFRDEEEGGSEGKELTQVKELVDDTTSKRKRLHRAFPGNEDDDGSNYGDSLVEEEDEENGPGANKGISSIQKKLRMSFGDDDYGDEQEGDNDETIDIQSGKIKPRTSIIVDNDEDAVKPTDEPISAQDKPNVDEKEKVLPKKGSIVGFFAPISKTLKTSDLRSLPKARPDTYGVNIMNTPPKKFQSEEGRDHSAASPQPSITPVPKLMQRMVTSRYFSTTNDENGIPSPPLSPQTLAYSGEDGEGENSHGDKELTYQTTHDRMNFTVNNRRNVYGSRAGLLGRSRLGSRFEASTNFSYRGPPSDPFDLDRYKATPSAFNSVQRGLHFSKAISPLGSSSPSKADLALGSGRKITGAVIRPYENEPPAKAPSPTIIPGIQNLGNTCYLSASLQTLFGIPSFIAGLNRMYERARSTPISLEESMPLTRALLEVAVVVGVLPKEDASCISSEAARNKLTSSLAANPSALKKQMDVLTDKFAGYEQRDAHEFLSDLVDFLHDELTGKSTPSLPPLHSSEEEATTLSTPEGGRLSPKENKHPNEVAEMSGLGINSAIKYHSHIMTTAKHNNEDLPTDEYFHLNVRVCLECDSCGYSRSKDEMYRHLSVDVGDDSEHDTWTVERSLKQFFQPEKREVKCEKCQSGTTATQTMEVLSRPKALLLHFKRFIVTQEKKVGPVRQNDDGTSAPPIMEMVLRKNKAKILLEETLSISPYGGNANQILPRKYHLRGVVHHVGNTAFSGHYTTCARRTLANREGDASETNNAQDNEEQWVLFDDRTGTRTTSSYVLENERNQRNCYMALYELK